MRVYLVRHAEAKQGSPDELRPLSEKGVEDATLLGHKLTERQLRVQKIIHSSLKRAKQTASILGDCLGIHAFEESQDLQPSSSPLAICKLLENSSENLMLVGHMPFMSVLVETLTDHDTSLIFHSPQIACLERNQSGQWSLLWKEGV